jgi:serine/threonine-protein kinase
VFAGAPLLVLGRYRGVPGPITLRAAGARDEPWAEPVAPAVRDNPAVAAAWARGQVRKLEDRYVTTPHDRDAVERAIIATSLKFGVLSRFTAYVAVDPSGAVNPGGVVHRVTQPVEPPQGWASAGVACFAAPQTLDLADESLSSLRARSVPRASLGRVFERLARGGEGGVNLKLSETRGLREHAAEPPPPAAPGGPGDTDELGLCRATGPGAPPDALAGFQNAQIIGRGGLGTVYRAFDRNRGKDVVIKVTPADQPAGFADRLLAKAGSVIALSHPSIVSVFEIVRRGDVVLTIMEHVEGRTLSDLVRSDSRPGPVDAAKLVLRLAEALDHAHGLGVVHGDVEASNILVGPDGVPRLTDFAVYAVTSGQEEVVGNPAYLAPELLDGTGLPSPPADVYGLGVVLYLLLTGRLPYAEGGLRQIERALRGDAQPPRAVNPAVPEALEAVCLKAMARKPSDRQPSAAALAGDLRQFLGAADPDGPDKGRGGGRRRRFWK